MQDKVALVTGGAGGIGAAICRAYAAEGAHVVVADRAGDQAVALAAELGGRSYGCDLDVISRASIAAAVSGAVDRLGGSDILVNNAGIFDMAPILDITETSFDRLFAVNVRGLLFTL